ncbi:MAG: hypothetical protein ABW360_09835 [Phenylobacterium sp.]
MARVLILGQDPDTVDFTAPGIIPGMTADKVRAGLAVARKQLEDAGHTVGECMTDPGETAEATVAAALAAADYDVVVIGAGIRNPPNNLGLLETVINAVHRHAPNAAIAFNTRPDDSAAAAERWLARR